MNPDTNKLEALTTTTPETAKQLVALMKEQAEALRSELVRPDGSPVPKHWTVFQQDETVVVKDYTFRVAHMNESCIVLEPVGPLVGSK